MRPGVRRALRRIARLAPAAVAAVAVGAIAAGSLADLRAFRVAHLILYASLALSVIAVTWRRVHHGARAVPLGPLAEAEFGALVLVTAFALLEPIGGITGALHPLLYLVMAFLVAFLPMRVGIFLTAFAIALETAAFFFGGRSGAGWPTLAADAAFLIVFAGLHRLVLATQMVSGRAAGNLAVRARIRELEERARQYRLGAAGGDGEVDSERWVTAAVKEVEEAVGNALEVAECALHTHTVAVYLLSSDDEVLKLHDCRSGADDVQRLPIDAREGIFGAVLKRKLPMRLCGDIKGVSWYGGRKPVRSVLAVPLIDRRGRGGTGPEEGWIRGLLVADRLEPTAFTDDDERLLVATSREVLRAIEIERVMGWIRKARDEKDRFYAAIEELNRASKLDEVMDTTLRVVQGVVPLDVVAFTTCEIEEGGRRFHRVARVGGGERLKPLEGYEFPDNNGLVANAIRYGTSLPGRELRTLERPQIFDAAAQVKGLQSLKIIPVKAGDGAVGTIVCGARRRRAFDADAVRMLEVVASQAGQALLRAQLFAQTERMATTDGLTGLLNHRTFQSRFDEEIARAARNGRKVALLLTDIDHFKSINDTYGHATGDAVLKGVAKILQRCARSTDVVARYGGEEFAIVLPETDMTGGKIIAERIREAVMNHEFQTELGPLRCTLSVGIAAYPDVSDVKQELFEKTDQCLYHCKRMGRNRTTTVDEMNAATRVTAA